MLIFLYGKDAYRVVENSQKIIASYFAKHKSGLNFHEFDFENGGQVVKLEDSIKSLSFFDEVKLVCIKGAFGDNHASDKSMTMIKEYNLEKNKEVVLLFVERLSVDELKKKCPELLKTLLKSANPIKSFEPLAGAHLKKWINTEVSLLGCTIEPRAIDMLVMRAGNESWALVNEINKLCNYKTGARIITSDVALLVADKVNLNIFDLIDAISGQSRTQAFQLLYRELENARDPYYILTMIIYQFRNLVIIKDLADRGFNNKDIAKKAGIHPFVISKAAKSLTKYSAGQIQEIYAKLLEIDINAKQGQSDLIDSLYRLILN